MIFLYVLTTYTQYTWNIVDKMIILELYLKKYVDYCRMRGDLMATAEEKKERFKRVAENRTNRIIELIRLLGNCSNRSNYEYTEEDIRKIFSAIEHELKETKQKYQTKEKNRKFEL